MQLILLPDSDEHVRLPPVSLLNDPTITAKLPRVTEPNAAKLAFRDDNTLVMVDTINDVTLPVVAEIALEVTDPHVTLEKLPYVKLKTVPFTLLVVRDEKFPTVPLSVDALIILATRNVFTLETSFVRVDTCRLVKDAPVPDKLLILDIVDA